MVEALPSRKHRVGWEVTSRVLGHGNRKIFAMVKKSACRSQRSWLFRLASSSMCFNHKGHVQTLAGS